MVLLSNSNPHVEISCVEALRKLKLKFLIDTGAHISVILVKPDMIIPGTTIYHDDQLNISGVGKGTKLRTLGYSFLHLEPFIMKTGHKFHLLKDEDHNISFDGILGHDFFQNHEVVIDYKNQWMRSAIGSVPLLITQECNDSYKLSIPARTEQFIEIEIINPETGELVS